MPPLLPLMGWILGLLLPVPPPPAILPLCLLALFLSRGRPYLLAIALIPIAASWQVFRSPLPGPEDPSRLAPLRWGRFEGVVASSPCFDGQQTRFSLAMTRIVAPFRQPLQGMVDATLDGDCPLQAGDRIRCEGRLTLPRGNLNFGPQRAGNPSRCWLERWEILHSAPFQGVRKTVFRHLVTGLSPPEGRLLGSIVFGAEAFPVFPPERERFTLAGLAHILAASGLQVSLILGAFALPLVRFNRLLACFVGVVSIGVYLFLAGGSPSILRAALMGGGTLLGILFRRPLLPYRSLFGAAFLLLLWDPSLLGDLGFQFSFLATWALLHTMPRIAKSLPFRPWIAGMLATIPAVTLWVLPLQLYRFGMATPYGAIANLLAGPMVDLLTLFGLLQIPLSFLPPLHLPLLWLNHGLLMGLNRWVDFLLTLPAAHFCLHFPLVLLLFSYLCLWLFFRFPLERSWLWGPLLFIGVILACSPHPAELYALAVGQGDALLCRTPHNRWILIDAGPSGTFDAGQRIVLPFLRRMGCNRLDLLVLTHPHQDHEGGALALLQSLPVARCWESGQPSDDPLAGNVLGALLQHEIPFQRPRQGERFELDGVRLEALSPDRPLLGTRSDANNSSLILRLESRGWRVLLAGDAERELEGFLLRHPDALRADLLKVAHHGSRFGSSPAFLGATQAWVAVVSVGPNPFKQPNGETMCRLRSRMRTLRTDEGAVKVSFGEDLEVESREECFSLSRGSMGEKERHP